MRPPDLHMLCGTCHDEWHRGRNDRGLQDGLAGVVVKVMTYDENIPKEYCCVCGQSDQSDILFRLDPKNLPENWCDGDHGD